MLLVFDDEEKFRTPFVKTLPKMGVEMKVFECSTKDEIRNALRDSVKMKDVKVMVFDLSVTAEEAETLNFDILKDIDEHYAKYPIPIFIHSAFAMRIPNYNNLGTVFKIEKSKDSLQSILTKIQLFYDSGFLDIFSPLGSIEVNLHQEVHKAFIEQFEGNEIEEILESIKKAGGDIKDRTKKVFERIAVRALYQNMISAKKDGEENRIEEIRINSVENYYRRTSEFEFWTGDIFTNNDTRENVIILTPRCNLSNNNYSELMLCKIKPLDAELYKTFKKEKNLSRGLTDDVTLLHIGERYRFLTKTPQFDGGIVDFTLFFSMSGDNLRRLYTKKISLVDDLTNDIVRKFTSYILRGGVSVTELKEAAYYFEEKIIEEEVKND